MREYRANGLEKEFAIVVTRDAESGIGRDGSVPWMRLPKAYEYFSGVILGARAGMRNAVIMGRGTFAGLPPRLRPLPGMFTIVLTGNLRMEPASNMGIARSFNQALEIAFARNDIDRVFVVGGNAVFDEAVGHKCCNEAYLVQLDGSYVCDVFLPLMLERDFWLSSRSTPMIDHGDTAFRLERYRRRVVWPPEEM